MLAPCAVSTTVSLCDKRPIHVHAPKRAIAIVTRGARNRRTVDPHLGRFLNTDPIIANVFDGQSFAAYSYVRNNPLAFVDPSGFTEAEAWRLWRYDASPWVNPRILQC